MSDIYARITLSLPRLPLNTTLAVIDVNARG